MIDRALKEVFILPTHLDNTTFLITKSGFYDEHIMPEIREKLKQRVD